MEENNVVNTVVENPVIVPEVVENAVNAAIEPVQVPQITVPMPEQKTFLGLDSKTWTDIAVLGSAAGAGAILCKAIPWAIKKVQNGLKTAKSAFDMAKNGAVLNDQAQQPAQPTATEIPVPQAEATPVTQTQENK